MKYGTSFTISKRTSGAENQPLRVTGVQPLTSVSKALTLLLTLRGSKESMTLSQISRALAMNKVSALRLLVTLEQFEFVERDPKQGSYKIGRRAFYVGSGFIADGKQKRVLQIMTAVAAQVNHTVTLSVLDGNFVLFVERVDGNGRVKVTVDIGSRTAAQSSAAGRVLLSGLSDAEIHQRFEDVKAGSQGRTKMEELLKRIHRVRASGYATNNEESTPGLFAIAVPVRSPSGEHVAALGAAFPAGAVKNKEQERQIARQLSSAANEIEKLEILTASQIAR